MPKIGFIGLGLIGGSIAKAIRKYHPDAQIIAYDTNESTLKKALHEGTINHITRTIDEHFRHCSFIFLCAPVENNTEALHYIAPYLSDSTILTDVGSVKTPIHESVSQLHLGSYFVGGHPMAGSEKDGFDSAKDFLMENAYYVLTPDENVSDEKLLRLYRFIKTLKAIPFEMKYREHDIIVGTISHLPHILASSLVNFVEENDTPTHMMKLLAAGGFKDITRIASSSPTMWEQICIQNGTYIEEILSHFISSLIKMKKLIHEENSSAIHNVFLRAKNYRDDITDKVSGPLSKSHVLYCDILDEAGQIARIATILANNQISIKNIGIIHNREYEEGVLRIDFYEEEPKNRAAEFLHQYNYTIYRR